MTNKKPENEPIEGEIIKARKKKSAKSILNVIGVFQEDKDLIGLFKYNRFSNNIEYAKAAEWRSEVITGDPITDDDLVFMKYQCAKRFNFEPSTALVLEGLLVYSHQNAYHPVQAYIKNIKWDGVKRLDEWLFHTAGVVKDAYTVCVARKVMIASVGRIFQPGMEFHSMLILEGGQGIGKSSIVKILGGDWYANLSFAKIDRDTIDAMQGRWIIEVDELVGFNKADVEKMKSFITSPSDLARLAYGKITKNFKRQSIFIGTTNPVGDNTYFRDESGNRRFWPVVCAAINLTWLKENRDQLFAEAYAAFKDGEKPFLDNNEAIELSKITQEERLAVDPWAEVLGPFMEQKKGLYVENVTTLELAKRLNIDVAKFSRAEQTRIGNVMKKLGYQSKRVAVDGVKMTVYPVGDSSNPKLPAADNLADNLIQKDNLRLSVEDNLDNLGQPIEW